MIRAGRARWAIGIDIGGTKIAGGVVSADGEMVEQLQPVVSPSSEPDGTLVVVREVVAWLQARHPQVEAIGIGAAGMVEWPDGRIRWAPNNSYRDMPLRQIIHEASGLCTVVDNDANTAAWAEARLGKGADYMALLTVGTGIGAGLILNGTLFRGRTGIGAEIGHLIVDPTGGHRCGCGNIGCLEALASGTALVRYGRAAAEKAPDGLLATLAGSAAQVTGKTVLEAARAADPIALALFQRLGYWLGVGIASLVNLCDLELIAIGGGVADAGDLLFTPVRESFNQHVVARAHRHLPELVPAHLGTDAGWIGAAILALDRSRA